MEGLEMEEVGGMFAEHVQRPEFDLQHCVKPDGPVYTCGYSTPEVEAGGPGVQDHP